MNTEWISWGGKGVEKGDCFAAAYKIPPQGSGRKTAALRSHAENSSVCLFIGEWLHRSQNIPVPTPLPFLPPQNGVWQSGLDSSSACVNLRLISGCCFRISFQLRT